MTVIIMHQKKKRRKLSAAYLLWAFLIAGSIESCTLPEKEESERDMYMNQEVRNAMRRVQVAAEHYAAAHGGDTYPKSLDSDFKSFFPGGIEGKKASPFGPVNVFNGKNEFPQLGHLKDLHSTRFGERKPLDPGVILYCPLENGKGYAIVGGAHDGKYLKDNLNPGEVLVFSNFED